MKDRGILEDHFSFARLAGYDSVEGIVQQITSFELPIALTMLKQPYSGVLQASSPVFGSQKSILFSPGSPSPLSYDLDYHLELGFRGHEDDGTVSSLESLDSRCIVDAPPTPSIEFMSTPKLQGRYVVKSPSSCKSGLFKAKVALQPKVDHLTCYVKTPLPKPKKRLLSEKRVPLSPTSPKPPSCHGSSSIATTESSTVESLPYPLVLATPVSGSCVEPCDIRFDRCERKDMEIQKQAQEIEQLKGLVTLLVNMLGDAVAQNHKLEYAVPRDNPSAPTAQLVKSLASSEWTPLAEDQQEATSTPDLRPLLASDGALHCEGDAQRPTEHRDMPARTSKTMLRLSRLKQLRQEESPANKKQPHRNGKRHLYVSVAGNWGYYSGPSLDQNKCLRGCVVRFDNGDLYLGDMMCYVPSTVFFSDDHGLLFHGRGALYHGDGTVTRGLFHKHKFKE